MKRLLRIREFHEDTGRTFIELKTQEGMKKIGSLGWLITQCHDYSSVHGLEKTKFWI